MSPSGEWKHVRTSSVPLRLRVRLWWAQTFYSSQIQTDSPAVKRLRHHSIIKFSSSHAEVEAMDYVREHTSIPVPLVQEKYERGDKVWLVMECVPGEPLDAVWGRLGKEEKRQLVKQLAGYIAEMRDLPPPSPGFVGSAMGFSAFDHSLGLRRFGPFESIADFHAYCRLATDVNRYSEAEVARVHGRSESYRSCFSHGDLTPNNVLVHQGKISAIVDWECAGWFPEYWDYVKIHFGARNYRNDTYEAIDGAIKTYPEELRAMKALWASYSPQSYDELLARAKDVKKSGLSPERHDLELLERLMKVKDKRELTKT